MTAPVAGRGSGFGGIGTSPGLAINLRAKTALEGPQILVQWDDLTAASDSLIINRSDRHPPENETAGAGLVVWRSFGPLQARHLADLLVLGGRFYHYAAWARVDGVYLRVGTAFAFSGEHPYLEEAGKETKIAVGAGATVGSWGGSAKVTSAAALGASPGDWLRLVHAGPAASGSVLERIVKVWTVDLGTNVLTFEPAAIGSLPPPKARAARGCSMTFVTGTGKVQRGSGSWVTDGFAKGQRVRVGGAVNATGANGAAGVISVTDRELVVDAIFTASETTLSAVATEEPGFIGGDRVIKMLQRATRMQRLLYELLPPNWREDDRAAGQAVILAHAVLDDGQIANVGAPGQQYAFQRFMRPLGAELGRADAAVEALQGLYDVGEAPVAFLRGVGSLLGYVPPDDPDDVRQRALIALQPGFVRHKGVEAELLSLVESATGQDVAKVYGADRVVRLQDLSAGAAGWDYDTGLCSMWEGVPTTLAALVLTDALANFPVNGLAGWGLQPNENDTTVFTIASNTTTAITVTAGDMTAVAPLYSGTADNETLVTAAGHTSLIFAAGANTIVLADATSWATYGYVVGQDVFVSGCVNAGNNGWHRITVLAGATATVAESLVNETSTTAVVEGGVVDQGLAVAGAAWTVDALIGAMVTPNTSDTGGPGGTPRTYPVVSNAARHVVTGGGSLKANAAPGSSYRIAFPYRVIPPAGGRADPRPSVYTPLSESVFNDTGILLFVTGALDGETTRDIQGRAPELVPAISSVQVRVDGGGDGSADVEILSEPLIS